MKYLGLIWLCAVVAACSSPDEQPEAMENTNEATALTKAECIDKVLYYKLETTGENYDSISTDYFNEVIDYEDSIALAIQDTVWMLESTRFSYLSDYELEGSQEMADSLNLIIDDLKKQLKAYQKAVVGYVFVHTFSVSQDTMSMIFIMDKDCSKSDAIPVKTVEDIDPDDFRVGIQDLQP